GDEGKFKTAMVLEMAKQANSPESTSTALRNLEAARREMALAWLKAEDDRKMGKPVGGLQPDTVLPRYELTLKGGEKMRGLLLSEDADWIVIRTNDAEERIRPSEVTRMT